MFYLLIYTPGFHITYIKDEKAPSIAESLSGRVWTDGLFICSVTLQPLHHGSPPPPPPSANQSHKEFQLHIYWLFLNEFVNWFLIVSEKGEPS